MSNAKQTIAVRAGQELRDGQIINLGIGLPTLIADYVPRGVDVVITDRALFRRHPDKGFVLEEVAVGYSLGNIAACTDMAYSGVADDVKLDAFGE